MTILKINQILVVYGNVCRICDPYIAFSMYLLVVML